MSDVQRWRWGESFQQQVIGMILRDPQFLATYSDVIQYQYFETENLSRIAYMILCYYKAYEKIPTLGIMRALVRDYCHKFCGGSIEEQGNLDSCVDDAYSVEIDENFIRDKVVSFGREQKFRSGLQKAIKEVMKTPVDGEEDHRIARAFEILEESLVAGSSRDLGINFTEEARSGSILTRIFDSPTFVNKVPTGVELLDMYLDGGIGSGQVGIVGAGTGIGKSTVLTIFGVNAASYFHSLNTQNPDAPKKSVIHITCEISKELVASKYAAASLKTSLGKIRPNCTDEEKTEMNDSLMSASLSLSDVYIKEFPMDATTVEDIIWYLHNLIMKNGITPGMIIVDYADHIKATDENLYKSIGNSYKQLIRLAKKFQCPLWTASQTKRDYYDSDQINSAALDDSWKKAQLADVTMFLIQSPEDHGNGVARIFLDKNRCGSPKKMIPCWYLSDKVFLKSMSKEEGEDLFPQSDDGKQRRRSPNKEPSDDRIPSISLPKLFEPPESVQAVNS